MTNITIIDELLDFAFELNELLKEDWLKFKKFVKENKTYIGWFIALLITLQFTDIMDLGTSWDNYTKKYNIQMDGGGNAAQPVEIKVEKVEKVENAPKTVNAPNTKNAPKPEGNDVKQPKTEGNDVKQPKGEGESEGKVNLPKGKAGNSTSAFFSSVKSKLGITKKGAMGPVFGNVDKIFSYTQSVFVVITTILMIVGVLSIPVLIFLVLTYCVIKKLFSSLYIL